MTHVLQAQLASYAGRWLPSALPALTCQQVPKRGAILAVCRVDVQPITWLREQTGRSTARLELHACRSAPRPKCRGR